MKTTRGLIGFWACLIIGIGILVLQVHKYANDRLEFVVGELIICLVAGVLIFAPKVLSEAFGKLIDKYTRATNTQSSIPGGGVNTGDDKGKG